MLTTDTNRAPRARLTFRVGIVGHRPNRLKEANESDLRTVIRSMLQYVQNTVNEYSATPEGLQLYSEDTPTLRAITPLAEGTDRLFADAALDLGFDICCPMPFAQEVYERDFVAPNALEENSLERFRALLERADKDGKLVKFELNVGVDTPDDPYGEAGRIVLNQSDLLIVVWDGAPAAGPGSTVFTMHEAIRWHVPVVWIDAVSPHNWRVLRNEPDLSFLDSKERCSPGANREDFAAIGGIVIDELSMPAAPTEEAHEDKLVPMYHDYFRQRKARRHPRFVWKLFRDLVGSNKWNWQGSAVKDYVSQIKSDWPLRAERRDATGTDGETAAEWTNQRLREHYAWSDQPADLYGDKYRSTYIFSYLFAAVAVALALLPYAAGWDVNRHSLQAVCVVSELVILLLIIYIVWRGRRRGWHEHWIQYRILAELIRQLRLLVPLGGARPFPHVPVAAHLADYGDIRQTWMYWQMRAIARDTGIPSVRMTSEYLRQCADYLADVVGRVVPSDDIPMNATNVKIEGGQYAFHRVNAARSARIERRLYRFAIMLLFITVAGVVIHLIRHFFGGGEELAHEVPGAFDRWLMFASAALPALGAALAGIENQGEFARIHKRSHAMTRSYTAFALQLDGYLKRMAVSVSDVVNAAGTPRAAGGASAAGSAGASRAAGASGERVKADEVTQVAQNVARLMVDEVVDWRVMFKDRPVREP